MLQSDKINLGDYWYQWHHLRKAVLEISTDKEGRTLPDDKVPFRHAYAISRDRRHTMVNGYTHRFQKTLIQGPSLLGKGSYGKVWKAKFARSEYVALKQVPSNAYPEDLWKERDLLIMLKHKRIVNLIGAFHYGDVYYVLELCYCKYIYYFY